MRDASFTLLRVAVNSGCCNQAMSSVASRKTVSACQQQAPSLRLTSMWDRSRGRLWSTCEHSRDVRSSTCSVVVEAAKPVNMNLEKASSKENIMSSKRGGGATLGWIFRGYPHTQRRRPSHAATSQFQKYKFPHLCKVSLPRNSALVIIQDVGCIALH